MRHRVSHKPRCVLSGAAGNWGRVALLERRTRVAFVVFPPPYKTIPLHRPALNILSALIDKLEKEIILLSLTPLPQISLNLPLIVQVNVAHSSSGICACVLRLTGGFFLNGSFSLPKLLESALLILLNCFVEITRVCKLCPDRSIFLVQFTKDLERQTLKNCCAISGC